MSLAFLLTPRFVLFCFFPGAGGGGGEEHDLLKTREIFHCNQ